MAGVGEDGPEDDWVWSSLSAERGAAAAAAEDDWCLWCLWCLTPPGGSPSSQGRDPVEIAAIMSSWCPGWEYVEEHVEEHVEELVEEHVEELKKQLEKGAERVELVEARTTRVIKYLADIQEPLEALINYLRTRHGQRICNLEAAMWRVTGGSARAQPGWWEPEEQKTQLDRFIRLSNDQGSMILQEQVDELKKQVDELQKQVDDLKNRGASSEV